MSTSPSDDGHVERNGRKTLTTVQGLPKKFDQKKILKVIKKKFGMLDSRSNGRKQILTPHTACNGTIVNDSEMGEVIQLQGDQRKDVQEFLVAKDGLELDAKTIKVRRSPSFSFSNPRLTVTPGPWLLNSSADVPRYSVRTCATDRSHRRALPPFRDGRFLPRALSYQLR